MERQSSVSFTRTDIDVTQKQDKRRCTVIFSLKDVSEEIMKEGKANQHSSAAEIIARLKKNAKLKKIQRASNKTEIKNKFPCPEIITGANFHKETIEPPSESSTSDCVGEESNVSSNHMSGALSIFQELAEMSEVMQKNRSIISGKDYLRDPLTEDFLQEDDGKKATTTKSPSSKDEDLFGDLGDIIRKAQEAHSQMEAINKIEISSSEEDSSSDESSSNESTRKKKKQKQKAPLPTKPRRRPPKLLGVERINQPLKSPVVTKKTGTKNTKQSIPKEKEKDQKESAPPKAVEVLAGGKIGLSNLGKLRTRARVISMKARARTAENNDIQVKLKRAIMKSNTFSLRDQRERKKRVQKGKTISELLNSEEFIALNGGMVNADGTAVHITARTIHIQLKKMERKERQQMGLEDYDAPEAKHRHEIHVFSPRHKTKVVGKFWIPPVPPNAKKIHKRPYKNTPYARTSSKFLETHSKPQFRNQYSLLVLSLPESLLYVVDIDGMVKRHSKFPFQEMRAVPTKLNSKVALYHNKQYVTLAEISVWENLKEQFKTEMRANKTKAIAMWAGKGKLGCGPTKSRSNGGKKAPSGMANLQMVLAQALEDSPECSDHRPSPASMVPHTGHESLQFLAPCPRQQFHIRPLRAQGGGPRMDPISTLPLLYRREEDPKCKNSSGPNSSATDPCLDGWDDSVMMKPPGEEPAILTSRTLPERHTVFFPDVTSGDSSCKTTTQVEKISGGPGANHASMVISLPAVSTAKGDEYKLDLSLDCAPLQQSTIVGEFNSPIEPRKHPHNSEKAFEDRSNGKRHSIPIQNGPCGFRLPNKVHAKNVSLDTENSLSPSPPIKGKLKSSPIQRKRHHRLSSNSSSNSIASTPSPTPPPFRHTESEVVSSRHKRILEDNFHCHSDSESASAHARINQPSTPMSTGRVQPNFKDVWNSKQAAKAALVDQIDDLTVSSGNDDSDSQYTCARSIRNLLSASSSSEVDRQSGSDPESEGSMTKSSKASVELSARGPEDDGEDEESEFRVSDEEDGILILLVDSQPEYKLYFQQNFQMVDPHVYFLSASSSKEALSQIQMYKPDIILVNWLLKDEKLGTQGLCKAIRKFDEDDEELPIIVYLSGGNETLLEDLRQYGVTDFLSEPYTHDVLKDLLDVYGNINQLLPYQTLRSRKSLSNSQSGVQRLSPDPSSVELAIT